MTSFAIEGYKKKRIGDGSSGPSINRELATLGHFLKMAYEWGWTKNPVPAIRKYPENPGRIIALTDKQCNDLIEAAKADEDGQCWLFVVFALSTAMRHSEILSARYDHLDVNHFRLHIPEAKSGMREQPLPKELVSILQDEMANAEGQEGWIFPTPRPNSSKSGHRYRMNIPFKRSVERAGMDAQLITPHVLRHTAITKLVMAGVDLLTIQKISGHKTLQMIERYSHVHGDHIDKAIGALNIGRRPPESESLPDAITQELHKQKKRPSR